MEPKQRILLLDDERVARLEASFMEDFGELEIITDIATNAQEAEQLFTKNRYAALVVEPYDFGVLESMLAPKIDFSQRVIGANVPVIVTSTQTAGFYDTHFNFRLGSGYQVHLLKPFEANDLVNAVRKVISSQTTRP